MRQLARLSNRATLNQYASVIEQILMSGSNMLASVIVLKIAGVSQFGIYSFVFVLSTLVVSVFGTLLHRQMMLQIAPEDKPTQQRIFLATLAIEMVGLLGFLFLLGTSLAVLSIHFEVHEHAGIALAGAAYVVLMVLFDACKQYSYTTDNQVYSLRSTTIYVAVQLVMMALVVIYIDASIVVEATYLALCVGFVASLLANNLCQSALREAQWKQWEFARETFLGYFKQGRFSLFGMTISWAQNQSMNPFLMLVSGPTVAGYFSLGRLMIMPMAVVSQGLVNSSTPTLRKLFKSQGFTALPKRINSFILKTTLFSFLYVALLAICHFTGLFDRFVPEYSQVQWYLALWVLMISCSIWRFWCGQFFVVSMQFKLLLRIGIASLCVTASGMLIFGVFMDSLKLALLSVVAGELLAIALYKRQTTQQVLT